MSIPFLEDTLAQVQAKVAQFASTVGLYINSWQVGDAPEQLYQAFTRTMQYYSARNATVVRGFVSLDTATDPGDFDPYNPGNEALEPIPGFLSFHGENVYYTFRILATFATTSVTFVNTSNTPYTFAPDELTLARVGHPEITYRNAPMSGVYTGPGGTFTLAAGATAYLDVQAESPGSLSFAGPGELTVLVSGLIGVTVTNETSAIGTDREPAADYRARCRAQAASTSPNGAADAYRYLARTNPDGTPLLQNEDLGGDGLTAVSITRVYVSQASDTGIVNVYYADDDSGAIAIDVDTANYNITQNVIAVPDCITFTGLAANDVPITVTWAVKYQARYNGQAVTGDEVDAAINAALVARFRGYPIGGFDQTAGSGTIYVSDLRAVVERAHPAIYTATLASPATDTILAVGDVATFPDASDGTEVAG
jgi:uncharacterized phage protein gp47/JayE